MIETALSNGPNLEWRPSDRNEISINICDQQLCVSVNIKYVCLTNIRVCLGISVIFITSNSCVYLWVSAVCTCEYQLCVLRVTALCICEYQLCVPVSISCVHLWVSAVCITSNSSVYLYHTCYCWQKADKNCDITFSETF